MIGRRAATIGGLLVALLIAFGAGAAAQWRGWLPGLASSRPPVDTAGRFAIFWEAWNLAQAHYVDRSALDPVAMTYGATRGMLDALGDDGHTRFLSPSDRQAEADALAGRVEGIGADVAMRDRWPTIVAPLPGSPAERAGLRPGDRIEKVNDQDVAGRSIEAVGALVRGPPGTSVTLTVIRADGTVLRDIRVERARVTVPSVTWTRAPGTTIAHVAIGQFAERAGDELVAALQAARAAGATAIALDLRNDPGGLRDEAVTVASQFLGEGDVLLEQDAAGHRTAFPVKPGGVATDLPMVVLINGGTASSAEIVAGALQDHKRARLVGATTVGTGTVLSTYPLSDGSAVLIGTAEWLTPGGRQIWRRGITPDVPIAMAQDVLPLRPDEEASLAPDAPRASRDVQLRRAYRDLR